MLSLTSVVISMLLWSACATNSYAQGVIVYGGVDFAPALLSSNAKAGGVFTSLVLLVNFVALAGIFAGRMLQSTLVRDALVKAYVMLSDSSNKRITVKEKVTIVDAAIDAVLLTSQGRLSLRKLVLIAFIASFILGFGFRWSFFEANFFDFIDTSVLTTEEKSYIKIVSVAIKLLLPFFLWIANFLETLFACSFLLFLWRKTVFQHLGVRVVAMLAGAVLIYLLNVLAMYALGVRFANAGGATFAYGSLSFNLLVGVAFIGNGLMTYPMVLLLAWKGDVLSSLNVLEVLGGLVPALVILTPLSLCVGIVLFFSSGRILKIVTFLVLQTSQVQAGKLFNSSLLLFGFATGLCQLFGITL